MPDFGFSAQNSESPGVLAPQGAHQEEQGNDDGRRPYVQFILSMFFFVISHHEPFVDLLEVLVESESENRDGHGIYNSHAPIANFAPCAEAHEILSEADHWFLELLCTVANIPRVTPTTDLSSKGVHHASHSHHPRRTHHARRGDDRQLGKALDHLAQREAPNNIAQADSLPLAKDFEAAGELLFTRLFSTAEWIRRRPRGVDDADTLVFATDQLEAGHQDNLQSVFDDRARYPPHAVPSEWSSHSSAPCGTSFAAGTLEKEVMHRKRLNQIRGAQDA